MEDTEGFEKLTVEQGYDTYHRLGGKPLEFNKYYDIRTPNGTIHKGCRVSCDTHRSHGRGGMDEDHTYVTGYFEADGLRVLLRSGLSMRLNREVTDVGLFREKQERISREIADAERRRTEIDSEIANLKESLG